MLPTEAWKPRDSGLDARFLDIFDGSAGGERVERTESGCVGRTGTEEKKLHSVEEKKMQC